MPLAEKGVRGKGRQPFAPPQLIVARARSALRIQVLIHSAPFWGVWGRSPVTIWRENVDHTEGQTCPIRLTKKRRKKAERGRVLLPFGMLAFARKSFGNI